MQMMHLYWCSTSKIWAANNYIYTYAYSNIRYKSIRNTSVPNGWVWSQEQIRLTYTHDDAFGQTQVINCAKAISILCCHKKGKQHSTNRFFNIICRDYLLGSFFFYAPGITVRPLREKKYNNVSVYQNLNSTEITKTLFYCYCYLLPFIT